jgi:hypothetical protein
MRYAERFLLVYFAALVFFLGRKKQFPGLDNRHARLVARLRSFDPLSTHWVVYPNARTEIGTVRHIHLIEYRHYLLFRIPFFHVP